MRKVAVMLLLCFAALYSKAQDAHVTQKFNNPLFINPANTGNMHKANRLTFLYRDQWRSVIVPYSSTYLTYDRKFFYKNGSTISGGVQFFYDKAGDGALTNFNPLLSVAYSKGFWHERFVLSTGFQFGYLRRSINANNLTFDSQFTGSGFNPDVSSGEVLENGSLVNMSVGLNLKANVYGYSHFNVGFAVHNPHQPDFSFSTFSNDPRATRYNTYLTGDLYATLNWSISPAFHWQWQDKARDFQGFLVGNYHTHYKNTPLKLSLGFGYRKGDALLTYLGTKVNDVQFGFSFDVNLSSFDDATNNKGGFELSLQYEFERKKPIEIIEIPLTLIDTIYIVDTLELQEEIPIEPTALEPRVKYVEYVEPPKKEEAVPEVPPTFINLKNSLPLQIYFDNDHPNPDTYDSRTDIDYLTSYNAYLNELQNYQKAVGTEEANAWFAEVQVAKSELDEAVEQLKTLIADGYKIKLTLKGYTSPLAASQYNTLLSMRRIESVLLYLKIADNGALKAAFKTGKIKVVENPFGESFSPLDVNDDVNQKKKSVFSRAASYERRVEIIAVELID